MQIQGSVKCGLQYRYITLSSLFTITEFRATDLINTIQKKYNFSELGVDEDATFWFQNGRTKKDGQWFAIDKLEIGNVGLNVIVHGHTQIAKGILDEVVEIIDSSIPHIEIIEKKKRDELLTIMTAKLDINPEHLQNPKLVASMMKQLSIMRMTEFSDVQLQFPVLQLHFVSKPDIKRILAEVDTDEIQAEIDVASGDKQLAIRCKNPEDYRNRIFEVTIEGDFEFSKTLLESLEKELKTQSI